MYVPVTCLLLLLALCSEGSSGNSKANVDKRNKAVKLMDLGSGEVRVPPCSLEIDYLTTGSTVVENHEGSLVARILLPDGRLESGGASLVSRVLLAV
ncbi:unnamed protein product [Timema podura]|uniref:Uncharacterized protein n=1 Tax=Timema podura TaxID=61482 RepID=A0ABN7PNQ7_TIMPD|nr:unnamed protein product [Timema podura]